MLGREKRVDVEQKDLENRKTKKKVKRFSA